MIRKEAVAVVAKRIGQSPIISANGFISRDVYECADKPGNFYMIGSMGLASSIGLGVALKNPKKKVYVFDGDGNILMNLGSLVTIGSMRPKNLVHIVFDNNAHESTGGQPTSSDHISIASIARAANYKTYETSSEKKLIKIINEVKRRSGPIMVLIKIDKGGNAGRRIDIDSRKIKSRFMKSL